MYECAQAQAAHLSSYSFIRRTWQLPRHVGVQSNLSVCTRMRAYLPLTLDKFLADSGFVCLQSLEERRETVNLLILYRLMCLWVYIYVCVLI